MTDHLLNNERKSTGAHYTPKRLAAFVARQVVDSWRGGSTDRPVRVADPAVGDGALLLELLDQLKEHTPHPEVFGFETDATALAQATGRLNNAFPNVRLHMQERDFLEVALSAQTDGSTELSLFEKGSNGDRGYDLVIANPPYVRTQVMGAETAQRIARQFGLKGRVDLAFPFILGIGDILAPGGVAGIIVSNRFMTTRAGRSVRNAIMTQFEVLHIWDLGDTKLFEAAVLPAVLLLRKGRTEDCRRARFTSIYAATPDEQTSEGPVIESPIDALDLDGVVRCTSGGVFHVRQGVLNADDTWTIATDSSDEWLATVMRNKGCTVREIGKVRVGVKTTADKVFIRSDWEKLPEHFQPELLKPLVTHHVAGRFRPRTPTQNRRILYPHEVVQSKRIPIDLEHYPRTRRYLEQHRAQLAGREYVIKAGRRWYEIWVPQDPAAWRQPKVVFRDIAEKPTFWMDLEGSVVNGDCYWITADSGREDDLWLILAVCNSTFIEEFYDRRFHNKLYARRRRFMTQYVEQFPLPDPGSEEAVQLVRLAKELYQKGDTVDTTKTKIQLDQMVRAAFGLAVEEVLR